MSATRDRPMDRDEVAHAIHRSHEQHANKLEQIRQLLENTILEIGVGGTPTDRYINDWPAPGKRRYSINDRRVSGNDGLSIPAQTTATLVMAALPGRIGGSIVNSGANACTLYLAEVGRAQTGVGALWLAASGGAWDFRLGNAIWAGPISAISTLGTTLVIAQV